MTWGDMEWGDDWGGPPLVGGFPLSGTCRGRYTGEGNPTQELANAWVGLFTWTPDEDGEGGEEYGLRVRYTQWRGTNPVVNNEHINIPVYERGRVTGWGIWDQETDGNLIAFGWLRHVPQIPLPLSHKVERFDVVQLEAGSVRIHGECVESKVNIYNEDYVTPLRQLLPRGRIWKFKPGGVLDKLFRAAAREWSRIERRVGEMLDESNPLSAQETLPEWEEQLDLPGECDALAPTLYGRQVAAWKKYTAREVGNRPFFLALAASLGYPDLEIIHTHDPFTSISACDAGLYGPDGGWTWAVRFVTNATTENDDVLQCLMTDYLQAHEVAVFEFPE